MADNKGPSKDAACSMQFDDLITQFTNTLPPATEAAAPLIQDDYYANVMVVSALAKAAIKECDGLHMGLACSFKPTEAGQQRYTCSPSKTVKAK